MASPELEGQGGPPVLPTPDLLAERMHPDAAGVDVGAREMVVAVPADRDPRAVRTFGTTTGELRELCAWLQRCRITTVAVESTGNYWITLYQILEEAGLEVCLINAQHVASCGRKKTDVSDAQWLQQLHTAGLLRRSFRPAREIVPLRYLLRHRAQLVASAGQALQHMQKVCLEMNLRLAEVFSDLDGESGLAILRAILAGERAPDRLAALRSPRCRAPLSRVLAALEADYREEYLFVLQQCLERWDQTQQSIAALDERLCQWLAHTPAPHATPAPAQARALSQKGRGKNALQVPVASEAWRFYGVDLLAVDGISHGLVSTLMTEAGTGEQIARAFANGRRFASWLGLCPDNRVSGGKIQRAKTRPVRSRLAAAFRLAANGAGLSKGRLGDYCRRLKGRLGKAEGITATAHKLARIVYALVTTKNPYDEARAFALTPQNKAKRLNSLIRSAEKLGFRMTLEPLPEMSPP